MGSHLPVVARRLAGWAAMPLGPGEGVAPMLFSKLFHLEREIGQVDISFSFNYILFVNVFLCQVYRVLSFKREDYQVLKSI